MAGQDSRPTAFVTGGSYGVGAATALALAREGYDIAVSATRTDNLKTTVSQLETLGARVLPLALDLRSQASIEQAMAAIADGFGRLDLLVNNAGTNLRKLAVDVTREEWEDMIAVNATGTFFLTQQVGRHMIAAGRGGSVVSIASTHAVLGALQRSTYGMAKAAIVQMTRMLAVEWAPQGIRVNAVAPGRMETPSPSRADTGSDARYMAVMLDRIPLHRFCTVEEVAAAVVYLAGRHAASITGQVLMLDGGLSAT